MNRHIIFVGGKRFTIKTEENEEYMKKVVERLETKLKSIMSVNPKMDKDSAALLASLDYCDEENKMREKLETIKEQIKDYLAETERLHNEIAELKSENALLQMKIDKMLNVEPEKKAKPVGEKKVIATGKIKNSVPQFFDGAVQQSLFNNEKK